MRFDTKRVPRELVEVDPQVGDVYAARQSGRNNAKFHVVVALSSSGLTVHYLSLDADGEIVGSGQYGRHVFEQRDKVGRATLPEILDIEWL